MPDETKPDATRPAFRLRAALAVPAGWPPDVAPNQIITAAHINSIKASVYAWPGDVDGQNHTLSNVHLANATGVLADPTTLPGDLIARGATSIDRFAVGAAGQVLTVDLALPQKLKWATPALAPVLSFNTRTGAVLPAGGDYTAAMVGAIPTTLLTTKGDLIAFGTVAGRMPAGSDGQILRADSASTPFGLRWGAESVPSVFGRSGAPVVAQAGDYTASQVTNAVSTIATYPDPAWITSLSWAKLIGVPSSFTPAAHTHDAAAIVSGVLATARLGTGVANNTVYLRGDGTWAAAGSGGGGGVISVFGRAGTVIAQAGDYTPAMVGAIPDNLLTSTGDLLVRNNVNQTTRLPIGANGQVLQTDLATSVGMKWTTISASVQTPWVTNIDAAAFNLVNVGRLGVALAVPNYAVDVVGDVNYTGVLRSNGVPVVFGGSQTPWTQNINASGFSLNNAGTIGVGVTAPQAAPIQVATHTPGVAGSLAVQDLDATTSGNPVLLVTGLGSEGTRSWAVGNRGGATYGKDLYVWNDRSSDMLFGTNSAERMRITSAGNVGIGTASPSALLQVGAGTPLVAGIADFYGANRTAASSTSMVNVLTTDAMALDKGGTLGLGGAGGGNPYQFAIIAGRSENNAYAGYFQVCTNTSSGVSTERMRITSAGNVGIGTTGPQASLHVSSSAVGNPNLSTWGTEAAAIRPGNGQVFCFGGLNAGPWTAWLQITDKLTNAFPLALNPLGGNVGIGTTSPVAKLQVSGIATSPSLTHGTNATVAFSYGGGTELAIFHDTIGGFPISLQTRHTSADGFSYPLCLNPLGGNVGVGTTSPGARLSVAASGTWNPSATAGMAGIGIVSSGSYGGGIGMIDGANMFGMWGESGDWILGSGVTSGALVGRVRISATGDVSCSGLFRSGGLPIAHIVATSANGIALNNVYQNGTGKPMFVNVTASVNASQYMQFLTDAGNPPTFIACAATNATALSETLTVSAWVMPGHYYKVFTGGASMVSTMQWY